MVEKSIVFDFIRNPNFFDDYNQSGKFNVTQMDGSTKNFEFVLMSDCEDNIDDQMNADGTLPSDVGTVIDTGTSGQVAMSYEDIGNGNRTIGAGTTDITLTFSSNEFLKGVFLVHKTTRYILAYTIFQNPVPITNQFKISKDAVFWTLRSET